MLLIAGACLFSMTKKNARASETEESEEKKEAGELTGTIRCSEGSSGVLTDKKETTYIKISEGGSVTNSAKKGIASLYVIFDRPCRRWSVSDGTSEIEQGKEGFLHAYVNVTEAFKKTQKELTLSFPKGCSLAEIHLFGTGSVPDWVQIWQPPCEKADLALFSTHIDDEQLFFAGVLPYYAGEQGLAVQVIYFTDPFSYHDRPHEQLNGLWTVGVRHYPVCGPFPDAYSETAADAYAQQERYGYSKEDMVRFQVENLRRFQPHVVIGHDKNGEYGHGQHRVNSETLREALDLAADASYDPDSASKYGIWDTPKAYFHLWPENQIVMDWDLPLDAFDGKTAFQVTQEGFLCHASQQWTWFRRWIFGREGNITRADQIRSYSPCQYGLYRSTVGPDEAGGDFFEHIPLSYAELAEEERQKILEEQRRAEEESRRVEEESRREEEARLAEEQRRLEEEARQAEEQQRLEEEARLAEEQRLQKKRTAVLLLLFAGILAVLLMFNFIVRKKQK